MQRFESLGLAWGSAAFAMPECSVKKLLLAVIDGARPAMVEHAAAEGHAPALATLIERGSYESATRSPRSRR